MNERARLIELIISKQRDAAFYATRAIVTRELGFLRSAIEWQQWAADCYAEARLLFETLHYRHFPAHIALHGDK